MDMSIPGAHRVRRFPHQEGHEADPSDLRGASDILIALIHFVFFPRTPMLSMPTGRAPSQPDMLEHENAAMAFRLLTVADVSTLLGVAPVTVYRLVARRVLPCCRLTSRRLHFRLSDVQRCVNARMQAPPYVSPED